MSVATYTREQSWFARSEPKPHTAMRLICLPYAGSGAAIYRPWLASLPPEIELSMIQLPGRETRLREPPLTRIEPLIEMLAPAIESQLDRPYVLFGHSMGALIAFELARALRRRGAQAPCALMISGRRAPQLPDPNTPLHELPEAAFIAAMIQRYNSIPKVLLDDLELLRVFLPTLRADLALVETYTYIPETPLDCPIVAFGGRSDPQASAVELEAWQAQTSQPLTVQQFPGGHFYLQEERAALIKAVVATALRSGQ
jgi:medium-chain acyl-[acyl-carrier-protein] hydrolase